MIKNWIIFFCNRIIDYLSQTQCTTDSLITPVFTAETPAHSQRTTAAAQTAQRSWGRRTPSMSPGRDRTAGVVLREAGGTQGCRWWAADSWQRWRPSRRGERTRWVGVIWKKISTCVTGDKWKIKTDGKKQHVAKSCAWFELQRFRVS